MNNTHTQDETLEVREMMLVAPQNQKRENHLHLFNRIGGQLGLNHPNDQEVFLFGNGLGDEFSMTKRFEGLTYFL